MAKLLTIERKNKLIGAVLGVDMRKGKLLTVCFLFFPFILVLETKAQSNDILKYIPTPKYFLDSFTEFRRNYMNLVTLNSSATFSANGNCITYAFNNNKQNNPKNSLFSICVSSKEIQLDGGVKEIRETLFFTTDKNSNGRLSAQAGVILFVRRGKDISLTPKENLFQLIFPSLSGATYYFFSFPDFAISYLVENSSLETKVKFKIDTFYLNWLENKISNDLVKSLQVITTAPSTSPIVARIKSGDVLFYYNGELITPASYSSLISGLVWSPLMGTGIAVQNGAIARWGWPNIGDLK